MSGAVKLTKAQRKFLEQLETMAGGLNPGFDVDVLRGPETMMARRLSNVGLVDERFKAMRGSYWDVTPAGLTALKDATNG